VGFLPVLPKGTSLKDKLKVRHRTVRRMLEPLMALKGQYVFDGLLLVETVAWI
jgi:hypothetical protein